ncbi:MAG: YeeE/YedE family protein [Ignavibacteria bacterium]|nr:YeeE/YedE family protein [Ignavibacteria bacterium]
MAPLVPDIISNEFNFVIAILIGIAFGYILEQAGFSSSKKLVGLFYGYDFTVLRVFFTAGITAMMGVIGLAHYGLLDLNIIYVNPTFLRSAIVGGLIMGLGFVIGGFCPGTSICAASIGKIDAMIFVAGIIPGVYLFAEGYPYLEHFYMADAWGYVTLFQVLGISQGLIAFLMIFAAVAAFVVTTFVEKRVNGKANPEFLPAKKYFALAGAAVLIGLTAFALPERQSYVMANAEVNENINTTAAKKISADELAFRIMNDINSFRIYDLRTKEEFTKLSLPNSENIQLNYFFGKDAAKNLKKDNVINIIISLREDESIKANYIAAENGYNEMYILQGGLQGFNDSIINFTSPRIPQTRWERDTYSFREAAKTKIPGIIENFKKQNRSETKKTKRIIGGC